MAPQGSRSAQARGRAYTGRFGEDGRWNDASRSAGTDQLAGALRALSKKFAQPVTGDGGGSGPHSCEGDMHGDREAFLVRRHVKVRRGTA